MSTPPSTRQVQLGLVACAVVALLHQAVHWDWFIDDAAISFAYARNWAAGEGLVPLPGGERVEGYSNPTWVLLLAIFELVGLSGFVIAKPMGAAFTVGTLLLVHRIATRALDGRTGAALLAPMALALNAQFALWATSALENSLFGFLLMLGVERVLHERDHGGVPWSAMAFLGLAWTRPEGLMYAAIGGAWFLLFALRRERSGRSLVRVLGWVGLFWGPYLLLEALRLWYFAWPLPNTYYAKVEVQGSYPLAWFGRGWMQARDFADRLWHGWLLPVYWVALLGTRGRRGAVGAALGIGVALLLLYPGPERLAAIPFWPRGLPASPTFFMARIVVLGGLGALLPFAALGRPGGDARAITGHMAAAALFFAVYANGDWMGGYRWMSLLAPSLSVLYAIGLVELADRVEPTTGLRWRSAGWTVALLGLAVWLPPNLNQTRDHRFFNRDETPFIVKRRADYTTAVARATFHDEPIVNLEMDQGAHMWWFPHYEEVDMAGLIDIPMSRHRFGQRRFVREYVFEERNPTFAHVHGNWAQTSAFKTYDTWDTTYVQLPRYDDLDLGWHDGVWARRDLFVRDAYPQADDRQVTFADGIELVGLDVPVAEWTPGHEGFVELALRTRKRTRAEAFTAWLVLSDGAGWVASQAFEPGVGYYPVHLWEPDDIYVGGVAFHLPDDAPTGPLSLGLVLVGDDGRVLPAGGVGGELPVADGATVKAPHFARGEVRFDGLVTAVTSTPEARAESAFAEVSALADDGACHEAEQALRRVRRHRPRDWDWHPTVDARGGEAIAGCWARHAEGLELPDAAQALARAHRWDHHHAELARVGAPVGDAIWAAGMAAREAGDAEAAYRAFADLLGFQPWRSWARRYAEEARDARLDLTGLERPTP